MTFIQRRLPPLYISRSGKIASRSAGAEISRLIFGDQPSDDK
jgi:hypothetical protein